MHTYIHTCIPGMLVVELKNRHSILLQKLDWDSDTTLPACAGERLLQTIA